MGYKELGFLIGQLVHVLGVECDSLAIGRRSGDTIVKHKGHTQCNGTHEWVLQDQGCLGFRQLGSQSLQVYRCSCHQSLL